MIAGLIYERTKGIFEQLEDLELFIEDFANLNIGMIRVGCPQSMSKYVMPGWIERFNGDFPGIKVTLNTGTSKELIKSVIDRRDEIAVIGHIPVRATREKINLIESLPTSAPLSLIS